MVALISSSHIYEQFPCMKTAPISNKTASLFLVSNDAIVFFGFQADTKVRDIAT